MFPGGGGDHCGLLLKGVVDPRQLDGWQSFQLRFDNGLNTVYSTASPQNQGSRHSFPYSTIQIVLVSLFASGVCLPGVMGGAASLSPQRVPFIDGMSRSSVSPQTSASVLCALIAGFLGL